MAGWLRDRYEVLETLGSGGQGRVVRALDHQHERPVALKLRPVHDATDRDELLAEARVLLALPPHPALPLVREDFFDGDTYIVAMDWVDGVDLGRALAERGRPGLDPSAVLAYLAEASEALTYLHSQTPPVVHGDVKPANLILTRGGHIKLVDFGLSSIPGRVRSTAGTPGFRAPELLAGGQPSRASDVFALAATAFTLFTGAEPAGVLPTWDGVDPAQATQLEAALRLGLATDPSRRPASAGELVERLRSGWGAALPTGVVTFCLSDIEGSSMLWDEHPSAMALALVRHDELVADAVAANGGRFLKSMGEGDSTVSVFDAATDALAASIEATRALEKEQWPAGVDLRARWGLHTGEAERRDSDYFGPAVGLAARLRGEADGGQIFLSGVTADLVRPALPVGVELVDLGMYSLRGFRTPERVSAVSATDIAAPFPATDCPYRGLVAFEAEDRDLFFGREAITASIQARTSPGRLLGVVGASGSGKSSLLRAGLVGAAHDGSIHGVDRALVITPGPHPSLVVADEPGLLLVVDQLEEVFTLCNDGEIRSEFLAALLGRQGAVAIGLRADFYGHCAPYPEFREAILENQVLLGPMRDDELRAAIVGPAKQAGLRVEDGVVELLVREVQGQPGALPLLSHALRATWEHRTGRTLTLDAYRAGGGVRDAIAQTASNVMHGLSDEDRRLARTLLLRLVQPGEGTEDTRRKARATELASETETASVARILDGLADARLVTIDEGTVELSHEALLREWPQLRTWIEEDREKLQRERHLSTAASAWAARNRDPAEHYRGARLASALELADVPTLEREFLDASRAAEERTEREQARTNRRLRLLLTGVGVGLVVALIAAVVAVGQRRGADEARDRADVARVVAVADSAAEQQPDLGLLLALAAHKLGPSDETRGALLGALATHPLLAAVLHGESTLAEVAFTPDGRRVVTPSEGASGSVVWDVATGDRLAVLRHEGDSAAAALVLPDGHTLVVPSYELRDDGTAPGALQVWDLDTGKLLRRIPVQLDSPRAVALSADRSRIVVSGTVITEQQTAELGLVSVDTASWRQLGPPVSISGSIQSLGISQDGETVLAAVTGTAGDENETVRVFHRDGSPLGPTIDLNPIVGHDVGYVSAGATDASGSMIAVATQLDARVVLLNPETGARVGPDLHLTAGFGTAISFRSDGRVVGVGRSDGRVELFELPSGRTLGPPLAGSSADIYGLGFAPDGSTLVSTSYDRSGAIWNLGGRRTIGVPLGGQAGPISTTLYTKDGRSLLTSGDDGTVAVRDSRSGRVERLIKTSGTTAYALAIDPRDRLVAAGGTSGAIEVFEIDSGRRVAALPSLDGYVMDLAFDPRSRVLAAAVDTLKGGWYSGVSGPNPGEVHFFDVDTATEVGRPIVFDVGPTLALEYAPDGERMAIAALFGSVHIYDTDTRKREGEPILVDDAVLDLSYSPDGRHVAGGTAGGTIRVWDVATHKEQPALKDGVNALTGVAYSPDGRRLASTTYGTSETRVFDLATGRTIGGPLVGGHTPRTARDLDLPGTIFHYPARPSFSPDGLRVAAAGFDGAAVLWDLRPDTWRRAACEVAGRELTKSEWHRHLPGHKSQPLCVN